MTVALIRPVSSVAWDLRSAWAKGWRISLAIDGDVRRVEGFVETVSPTDASAVVSGLLVPLSAVLAVFRPSRLGDSTYEEDDGSWNGRIPYGARRDPRQLYLPGLD